MVYLYHQMILGVFFTMTDIYQYAPKIVLNKYKRREDGRTLPIQIFGSSSKQGTAIYVAPVNILFDIGVNFQKLKHIQDEIDYIIVSHEHSDHIDWATLHAMLQFHPMIQVVLPADINIPDKLSYLSAHFIQSKDMVPLHLTLRSGLKIDVLPVKVPHGNTSSFSYDITFQSSHLLFSTDLSDTEPLPKLTKYDIIMIETNYDEDEFLSKDGSGGAINHLSVQQALRYALTHLSDYGKIIPLHFGPTMQNFNQLQ